MSWSFSRFSLLCARFSLPGARTDGRPRPVGSASARRLARPRAAFLSCLASGRSAVAAAGAAAGEPGTGPTTARLRAHRTTVRRVRDRAALAPSPRSPASAQAHCAGAPAISSRQGAPHEQEQLVLTLGLGLTLFATAASAVFVDRGEYAACYRNGELVGGESRDCDNNLSQWGEVTDDYDMGYWVCGI